MAITGTWKTAQDNTYAGAQRQGTGVNPVHGIRAQVGRGTAPDGESVGAIDPSLDPQFIGDEFDDNYGYTSEDYTSTLWGYGVETGLADRPRLGELNDRNTTDGFPTPGNKRAGLPGGSRIRAVNRGSQTQYTAKQTQPDAAQGHFAKADTFGGIEDAMPSDPSQYEMQTSMIQMSKNRTGSQRSASASDHDALVPGTRPTMGQRRYVASNGERHREMEPRSQDLILRPFWFRSAGTGNPDWLAPNAMYVSDPLQRVPTANPYTGPEIPVQDVPGFVDEGWSMY